MDSTDRQLLSLLRDNARLSVAALAKALRVARGTVQACQQLASGAGTDLVVLSGGVFQNRRLLETAAAGLDAAGLRVLTPERLPGNDGGIAYGQAAIAARRATASRS